jgi:Kdo2-lipid IVA lauroyltransferase/acyltransferase
MKNWLNLITDIFSKLLCSLPMRAHLFFGDAIGVLWFDVLRIRRREALKNLKMCLPNLSDSEHVRIARESVCNVGRGFIEFLRLPTMISSPAEKEIWRNRFTITGREHYEKALQKNRGVCLLASHVGNGDWAAVGLALNGIRIHIITKELKMKSLNDFWFLNRQKLGIGLISDRKSSLQILKLLKANEAIVFVLDQFMGPPLGVKTKFFGVETGTAMGLALLAGRAESPVVPVYTYRESSGHTHVIFEPEIQFEDSGNKDETITRMTQKYCDQIEKWVRFKPEQWMWVHRRWKKFKV